MWSCYSLCILQLQLAARLKICIEPEDYEKNIDCWNPNIKKRDIFAFVPKRPQKCAWGSSFYASFRHSPKKQRKKPTQKLLLSKGKLEGSEQSRFLCAECRWEKTFVCCDETNGCRQPTQPSVTETATEVSCKHTCAHLLSRSVAFTPSLHWQVCYHSYSRAFIHQKARGAFAGNVLAWLPAPDPVAFSRTTTNKIDLITSIKSWDFLTTFWSESS